MKIQGSRTTRIGCETLEPRTFLSNSAPPADALEAPSPYIADSLSASFPAFLNGGMNLKAPVVLRITNRTGAPVSGAINTTLMFSTDEIADAGDASIGTTSTPVNLALGTKKRIALKPGIMPNLPGGTYYLLAKLERAGAEPLTISTSRQYVVASPAAQLKITPPTLHLGVGVKSLGRSCYATFEAENIGGASAIGTAAVSLYAQAQNGQRTPLVVARPVTLNLKPGQTSKIRVKFATPPGIAPGTYSLVAELSPRTIPTATTVSAVTTSLTTFRV